jgi:hypothetical protein
MLCLVGSYLCIRDRPGYYDWVSCVSEAAAACVDAYLNDLQFGGPGHQVEMAGVTGDPTPFSAGIGGFDREITAASYTVQVAALGAPEWIRLVAEIHREEADEPAVVTFVFVPDGAEVVLVAMHAGSGTAVPAEDDGEGDS